MKSWSAVQDPINIKIITNEEFPNISLCNIIYTTFYILYIFYYIIYKATFTQIYYLIGYKVYLPIYFIT